MPNQPYSVKARDLKAGQWMHFPRHHDMLIGKVSDSKDGKEIRLDCSFGTGDFLCTAWYHADEKVLVINK